MSTVNGFEYASGPFEIQNFQPNSAFSRGDVVMVAGGTGGVSNISAANDLFASTSSIIGVVTSSSTESYRDLVSVVLALPGTVFTAPLESALSTDAVSLITAGLTYDIRIDTDGSNQREYSVASSVLSQRVVVVDTGNVADINSAKSCVLVRFLSAAGETAQA